ncbi:MAG: processive 1,2-diacylglycerol beta-glucosyltransferase [Candidatus Petromonas sp.]|nr:processive 1,2-diacylglycerol beta-glucosyltransferase [Candidatus Petromonas sp.]
MNIVFFTLSAGEGHNQVAKTLADTILSLDNKHNIKIIDTFNYINPKLHKVLINGYLKSIKYLPELYGFLYRKTEDNGSSLHDVSELFNKAFISRKLLKFLSGFKPDVIICTHPFPAEALAVLKKHGKISIPIIITVTDYALHSSWLNKYIDFYILPTEKLKHELCFWDVPLHKSKFYGIPVRKCFYRELDREEVCKRLDISNTFTALLMGGGLGLGKITETIDCLVNNPIDIQIIVITGKNEELYNNLIAKYLSCSNKSLKIYGYTPNIDEFMSVSDLIVTKPGGLTITEAIIKELPIIISSSLPGQEEKNIEFILNNGLGMRASNPNSLISCIKYLKENKEKYNNIKFNMSKFKKPKASYDIAKLILNLTRQSEKCPIN